jgi:hypothetical protein
MAHAGVLGSGEPPGYPTIPALLSLIKQFINEKPSQVMFLPNIKDR